MAYSIHQTFDGGYIICGIYNISYSYLLKLNTAGDTLWTKTWRYGSSSSNAYSVQQTTDGGYIITGKEQYSAYIYKTNSTGDSLWHLTFNEDTGHGLCVQQTIDGGYIVTGFKETGYLVYEAFLTKINAGGGVAWNRIYDEGNTRNFGSSVQQTLDGGFIVAGNKYINIFENPKVYLIKTNGSGNTLWMKDLAENINGYGKSIQQTIDGGYIIAGQSYDSIKSNAFLIKTDENGTVD
jgi:hypothetical protein